MIAIATGIDALDQKIKQKFEENDIKDNMIVNYREFLLKSNFDTVIISKKLVGNIEIEYLILTLRERDVRIMYLTNKDSAEEIKLCFKYGINDILTDPIDAELVLNVYNDPKKFSDVKKLFLMVNSKDVMDKTIDIDRLMEISGKQATEGKNTKAAIDKIKEEIAAHEEHKKADKDVKPLDKEDFPGYKKKEVVQQQTVYKMPNDYKKVIVILGTEPTGKTTLAVNMAWQFSKENIKTVLIDTDFKKKDIYFHFDKNFSNCLTKLSEEENVINLGVDVNPDLKIFTENKDCDLEFGQYDLMKLIISAKNHSQVVIIDLCHDLDDDTIKNILEIADNTIVVVDQKVTTLNRVPEDLAKFRNQLHNMSVVVNRYWLLKHLEVEDIKANFFENVDLPNGREFDYVIDKVFTIADDSKSVLQALANRTPAIDLKDNGIAEDIKKICASYYASEQQKKKGFLFFK